MATPFYSKDKEHTSAVSAVSKTGGFSPYSMLAWLFAIEERESLDEETGGDKSDGRWFWGM